MIWSKFRLADSLTDDELHEECKKRFRHTLPLEVMDYVVVESLKPEEQEEVKEEQKEPVSE